MRAEGDVAPGRSPCMTCAGLRPADGTWRSVAIVRRRHDDSQRQPRRRLKYRSPCTSTGSTSGTALPVFAQQRDERIGKRLFVAWPAGVPAWRAWAAGCCCSVPRKAATGATVPLLHRWRRGCRSSVRREWLGRGSTASSGVGASDRTTSCAIRGQPVRVTFAGYLLGLTSILQLGTAIAVYCRFMHRYTSPSRPPCWISLLAAGSISVRPSAARGRL